MCSVSPRNMSLNRLSCALASRLSLKCFAVGVLRNSSVWMDELLLLCSFSVPRPSIICVALEVTRVLVRASLMYK